MPALCLSVCLSMGICLSVSVLVFQYLCVFLCFCPCGTVDICALNYIGLFMWRGEEARRSRRWDENQCWASRVEIKTINSKAFSVDSCLSVLSYPELDRGQKSWAFDQDLETNFLSQFLIEPIGCCLFLNS